MKTWGAEFGIENVWYLDHLDSSRQSAVTKAYGGSVHFSTIKMFNYYKLEKKIKLLLKKPL